MINNTRKTRKIKNSIHNILFVKQALAVFIFMCCVFFLQISFVEKQTNTITESVLSDKPKKIIVDEPKKIVVNKSDDVPPVQSNRIEVNPILESQYLGDLSALSKRRYIRALVSYSRTGFFFDKNGRPRGMQVDLLTIYEEQLNKGKKKESDKIHIRYIPTTFDRLIPDLIEGKGDIVANLMTITPERKKKINFISGKRGSVQELIISHKSVKGIDSINDLSGQEIYVLKGSSYVEHLKVINQHLKKKKLAPIRIVEADSHLMTEEILELVNSGVVKLTVADSYIAKIWKNILPNINIHKSVAIKQGSNIGWAIRKKSPELQKSLNIFLKKVKKGTYLGNMLFKRYYKNNKWVKNPNTKKERKKFIAFIDLFEKYGQQYNFDALALAAQGYQESHLDHKKKSHRGAVGVMQLLPSTAADKHVKIKNINKVENNIHAGVKYLAFLRDRYFSDPAISKKDKMAFSWAAYNAGPAKVRKMRALAKKMNLDENVWFANVEVAAAKIIGRETVEYVSKIFKYYIAYSLVQKQLNEKKLN
ncbi:MAG: lytic transglycosylase F [Gammaproteobacteria bacterium]|nr:lytic transglycosylase F [Gammaproteobacteria bacterium]